MTEEGSITAFYTVLMEEDDLQDPIVDAARAILDSFQEYYETTTTVDEVDPQRLYDLQHELAAAQVFSESEVNGFAQVFYQLPDNVNPSAHAKLNAWLDPAVDRFQAITVEM